MNKIYIFTNRYLKHLNQFTIRGTITNNKICFLPFKVMNDFVCCGKLSNVTLDLNNPR